MISHVVLGDVAAERSATLRLQAEEFRQAKKADSARAERRPDARSQMRWRRGVVASADLGRSSRRSTRPTRTV